MADDVETPDPALAVACPWEGGCGVPAGTPCRTSFGGSHAERARIAHLRTLEHGICADCGKFVVRGAHEPGGPVEVWHPDPHDAEACPPMPDPREDWNAYARALQSGQKPGHVQPDRFLTPDDARAQHAHGDHHDLDTRIDALHGPGAAAALDAALADGSIFADAYADPTLQVRGSVSVEVAVICPECDNGKHQNCDGRALHPITDELTACTCPCTDQGATT